MKKTIFLFAIHCHQPVGNFDYIIEEAYQKSYLPFIKSMANHPRIRFTVHYSGILYDWFLLKHPEFIELLNKLIKRRQVEVLTGGYYEPILSLIPDQDKIGQIELSNHFIKDKLETVPAGLWLTERVWEPSLPKALSEAEVEYTLLDDHHFLAAGLSKDKLNGYYLTEDQGKMLKVFPIDEKLLELIPFKKPEDTIKYLKGLAGEKAPAAVFADDGEKFGFRQDNHHWIYKEDYLEKLLSLLEENMTDVQTMTFSQYLEEYPPLGQVYIPTASYPKMNEWSKLSDRDGFFRNFLIKYPEANNLHKKMLQVSNKLETLKSAKVFIGGGERDKKVKEAAKELYQGQCSCAYWHGLFGGLFHKHLREAVYEHLIKAEVVLEKFNRAGKEFAELSVSDLNKDGQDEVVIANSALNIYCAPNKGGTIIEIDYKPKAANLINTLTQANESASCLGDCFLSPDADLNKFSQGKAKELSDFSSKPYFFMPKRSQQEVSLSLSCESPIEGLLIKLEKQITLLAKQSIVHLDYKITNLGQDQDEFWFGPKIVFSLTGEEEATITKQIKSLTFVDEQRAFDISLEFEGLTDVWSWPLKTVSDSEGQEEVVNQGSMVFPNWKFILSPGQSWETKIVLRIEE